MSDKGKKILIATTNPGKIAELRAMLDADVEWLGLSDFEGIGEIEEDGATFAENARKKAVGYAEATGLWTIADTKTCGSPRNICHSYGGLHYTKLALNVQ